MLQVRTRTARLICTAARSPSCEIHDQLVPADRIHQVVIVPGDGARGERATVTRSRASTPTRSPRRSRRSDHGDHAHRAHWGSLTGFRSTSHGPGGRDAQIKNQDGGRSVRQGLAQEQDRLWGIGFITFACLCFFVGATGKSAQIPLYVWLPDAMAGPTPGVRAHPRGHDGDRGRLHDRPHELLVRADTRSERHHRLDRGADRAVRRDDGLLTSTIIKKVLAYSTVSQLGFMFIGVGVGRLLGRRLPPDDARLLQGLPLPRLRLGHPRDAPRDPRRGWAAKTCATWAASGRSCPTPLKTYWMACIAITAVPPGLAGFWSKDEILWKAFNSQHTGFVPGLADLRHRPHRRPRHLLLHVAQLLPHLRGQARSQGDSRRRCTSRPRR